MSDAADNGAANIWQVMPSHDGPVGVHVSGEIEIRVESDGSYMLSGPDGWAVSGREPNDPQEALEEARSIADRRNAKIAAKQGQVGFQFNEEQLEAIQNVKAFLRGPDRFYGVFGYAGTGKTSVIQEAVRDSGRQTVMSAPTHKAVGVLAGMSHLAGPVIRYDYRTIHSLLSLKPKKEKGVQVFIQDRKRAIPFTNYGIVIIDECSMIDKHLWGYVEREVENMSTDLFYEPTKVIVMGDKLQLPPVSDNNEASPAFRVPNSVLERVMRHGGVVGDAVGLIRDNIRSPEPLIADDASDEYGEIVNYDYQDEWLDDLVQHSSGNVKALAYTNRAVDRINKYVRKRLHGDDVAPYLEGEVFVAVEAYANDDRVQIQTEHEIRVMEVSEAKHYGLDCWKLRVNNIYTGEFLTIHALYGQGRVRYTRKLDRLAREKKWNEFWPMKEAFAMLRPRYATTVHKSQGSTYDRVYLLQRDILASCRRDSTLRNRLLYVAYSRTAHSLLICNE